MGRRHAASVIRACCRGGGAAAAGGAVSSPRSNARWTLVITGDGSVP
ncbi:hypothetical protein PSN01_04973 [Micromonospora saelicesensis]|nr:hypothetical protein PSN01_04973 [Micromonospora saelicesensis]